MNILLVSPKVNFTTKNQSLMNFWFNSNETGAYRELWSGVGSSLLTIAALTPDEHSIEFIDENITEIDFEKEFDIVGISAMTQQIMRGYQIADIFRSKGIPVVFGGIHPTLLPEEVKQRADSVVIGEAEDVWVKLLEDFKAGNLKPFYKSNSEINICESPIPKFELLKKNVYRLVNIQTTRGCPHDCDYCSASKIFGKKYRRKTVEQIILEIKTAIAHLGNVKIVFSDDNFLVDRKRSMELLTQLIPLNIKWHAQSDISIADDEQLLLLTKKSGCTFLFIGLESINPDNLKNLDTKNWKYSKLSKYKENIEKIQSYGIGVMGAFIVGLDSDTKEVFNDLEKFIIDNNLWAASITIMTPFPGTRLRAKLENENRLIKTDWSECTGYNVNFIPAKITREELEEGIVNLYKRIYSNENYQKKIEHFKQIQLNLIKNKII